MSPEEQFRETMEDIIQPTDSQRKNIEQILKRESNLIASIQQQRSMEFFAIFDSSRRALDALLTDTQKKMLEQNIVKTREKFAETETERLSRVLYLDNSQKKQIREIIARIPVGPYPGPEFPGRMPHFQEMKQNFEHIDDEINKVLTPEQQEKYREFRNRRPMPFERQRLPQRDK